MKPQPFLVTTLVAALLGTAGAAQAQATINQSKIQSWPYVLSQPGHYKLTGNIVVPAGMSGFKITAPNVTFDLNGFIVAGPLTCWYNNGLSCSQPAGAATGIEITTGGASVRGGTIKGFSGYGIATSDGGDKLVDLTVSQNAAGGVAFNGKTAALVDRSHVTLNGSFGMKCFNGVVSNSSIELNGGIGVHANACNVVDSMVRLNSGAGVSGGALLRGTRLLGQFPNKSGAIHSGGGNLDNNTLF